MANKTKKKNNKKKNKRDNSNLVILVLLVLITILIITIISLAILNKNTIRCSKTSDLKGYSEVSKIKLKYNDSGIQNIHNKRIITLKSKTNNSYLQMIKGLIEQQYKTDGVDSIIDTKDNIIILDLIDNLSINIEDVGLSYDIISNDIEGQYGTLDLSKKYSKKEIVKILKRANYVCK